MEQEKIIAGLVKTLNSKGDIYLRIKVRPASSKIGVTKIIDDTIYLDLKAKPEKGRANLELTRFLAKTFSVFKEDIKIISGAAEKIKLVKIIKKYDN